MTINKNKEKQVSTTNKIMFGFAGLFIVFLFSSIITLILISIPDLDNIDVRQHLALLATIQWCLLIVGVLLSSTIVVWWVKRGRDEYQANQKLIATLDAIYKSQAIIEFDMNGIILDANEKFLAVIGYTHDEIVGKHHSMLVDPVYKTSQEYTAFWQKLNRGEYDQAEYPRLKKNGDTIWLQSSYNPILNAQGKPIKVIKVATDVTARKDQEAKLIQLTNNLSEVGKQIVIDSNDISVGINELEATAVAQAASASQQATSITQISATIEEIKITTGQTLERATQLGESAARTTKEAEKGKTAIKNMNNSMKILQNKIGEISSTILGLNNKTQQISEITETVADIARQSKMLALNASIEAAKAGESGKGFAVVAGEVKELAEKSQLSTERVQKILQDIRQTAEKAVMVTESGTKSMDENIDQVQLTGDVINALGVTIEESSLASLQIVSAVREESLAIEQIDLSIKEVDKVTSLFASATEQTKQGIISLNKVAESLKNTAAAYKE